MERKHSGLTYAKSEGKTLGPLLKTTIEQRADIIAKYEHRQSVSFGSYIPGFTG